MTGRLALESSLNKLLKKSKLLVYTKSIGLLDPPQKLIYRMRSFLKSKQEPDVVSEEETLRIQKEKEQQYLANFESLVNLYGFDKERFTLLLDSRITPPLFFRIPRNE